MADGSTGAVQHAYASSAAADFSHDVLATSPARLLVSRLPPILWADWGTPERVIQSLAEAGVASPWAQRDLLRTRATAGPTGRQVPVDASSSGHHRA